MSAVLWVVLGLVVLVAGAELLVRGASRLAMAVGVSSLVIGLTVVAYGTSAPEFAVNVRASLSGQPDIAVGNVVGSNIYNVLVVLGLSALAAPLAVSRTVVRLDVPIMIGVSFLAWAIALDGSVGRLEGALLLAGAVGYTVFEVVKGRREARSSEAPEPGPGAVGSDAGPHAARPSSAKGVVLSAALAAAGLALLVLGARWLVDGASELARHLGVSELIIALTIVAAGTSLPETATSIVAAVKGERDIAIGNIVGSNIFNILAVLGIAGVISGDVRVASAAMHFDIPVMVAVAVACLPIFFTGARISRLEGGVFAACYVAYVAYLVLAAKSHAALPAFSAAMLWFALPATALGVALSVFYALRRGHREGKRSTP